MVEGSGVLTERAAVRIKQSGDLFAGRVIERFVEIARDGGAVLAFEMNVVDLGETELREESVVCFCEASEIATIRKKDFVGAVERADLCSDGAIFAERIVGHNKAARDRARDFAAGDSDAAEIFCPVIVGNEINGAAIRGEARATDTAVEREGQNLGFASGGRSDSKMMGGVDHGLEVGLRDEGDPFAVGGPRRRAVGAGSGGDLPELPALIVIIAAPHPPIALY